MLSFHDLSVAPMEGFTTFPMRLFLAMTSAPRHMTTPFLKVTRAFPIHEIPLDFAPELYELRGILPFQIVPQFIAGEIDCFLRAAELIPRETSEVIELNCGCPSPNSMGKFAGSGILQDPAFFRSELIRIIDTLGSDRIAIKMRVGVVSETEFSTLLENIADLRLARLTIHGRTKKAGYRGHSNWTLVEEAALCFQGKFPVLGSGDVDSLASLHAFCEAAPSAKGMMIGRGVLKNPWVFEEIQQNHEVRISADAFQLALYSYLLIQDLWQREPTKLLNKVSKGRVGAYIGTCSKAWEEIAAELSTLALGFPLLPFSDRDINVNPVAFDRLKILWTYLRGSLPQEIKIGAINKSRIPREFFAALNSATENYGQFLPLEIPTERE